MKGLAKQTSEVTSTADKKRREQLYEKMEQDRKKSIGKICENRKEFKEHVKFAT